MTNQQVADRYAKSLLDLAVESDKLEIIRKDVDELISMGSNRDLALLLQSPVVNATKKKAVMTELLGQVGADELTKSFVNVLITKGREGDLLGIMSAFDGQYNKMKKISSVYVTSATALSAESLAAIRQQLIDAGKTEANVEIFTRVDPKLMGGFVLEFGGKVYDASVAHKLNQIRKELAR